jgi:DNA-binding transcriptional LysR family regulator
MNPPAPDPSLLSWDLLAAFVSAMRTGSLSGASRELGVAQPTVRRQIESLEEKLGVVLFTRSPSGLLPTEAAKATMPFAEAMAQAAHGLVRAASAPTDRVAGTVRITASEVVGIEVLPPILTDLRRAHPDLQVELSPTNANEDLLRQGADIAVRMAQPTQGALVAKRVGVVEIGLFASEAYLELHPAPRSAKDLAKGHSLVGRDRDAAFYAALAAAGLPLGRKDFALRTDSDVAALAAVRAGLGIGLCQVPLAARPPRLKRVLAGVRAELPVWVVAHENLRGVQRVSVAFDHLVGALSAYTGS